MDHLLYTRSLEYVDTRGIYPSYVRGQLAIRIEGKPLNISLDEAREAASKITGQKF